MEFYNHIYLENSKLIIDKLFLFGLFVILFFLIFVLSRWFRGSITLKEKQLSLLALILVLLFGLSKMSEYQSRNDQEKIYKNTASVVRGLSEKFHVSEDEIYVNTKQITEHTVYKIRDKFYQIHWVDGTILVEEMKVPYIDEIKIFDK